MPKKRRHILGISGGKDSTALAILLHDKIPDLEYFFCDTGKELPETYEYIEKLEARLSIKVKKLMPKGDFDYWLAMHKGYLPSATSRWCTRMLKLYPMEQFVAGDEVYSYVGIREDEDRAAYLSTNGNVRTIFPFKSLDFKVERPDQPNLGYDQKKIIEEFSDLGISLPIREKGYKIDDVKQVIEDSGIGLPEYYRWRTRSGCFFCFFQRKIEWVNLAEEHPDLFQQAVDYETLHDDGRKFTWTDGESLTDLIKRKDEIIAKFNESLSKEQKSSSESLSDILSKVLDNEDDSAPCLICHL